MDYESGSLAGTLRSYLDFLALPGFLLPLDWSPTGTGLYQPGTLYTSSAQHTEETHSVSAAHDLTVLPVQDTPVPRPVHHTWNRGSPLRPSTWGKAVASPKCMVLETEPQCYEWGMQGQCCPGPAGRLILELHTRASQVGV